MVCDKVAFRDNRIFMLLAQVLYMTILNTRFSLTPTVLLS